MALLDGLAQYLENAGLVSYDPAGVTGDCFIETLPQGPDQAVALTVYGGGEPDSKLGYDQLFLQVRVRGTADPRISRARAEALYGALNGLGPLTLSEGTRVLLVTALQPPFSMGRDANNRHEHTFNVRLEARNVTTYRV